MNSPYREYPPSAALARSVECYWTRCSTATGQPPATHRVLPDGCIDIVFNFGGACTERAAAGSRSPSGVQGAAVVGTMTAPLLVAPGPREDFFGVRFRPGMARAFLQAPASEFTDAAVPLSETWGREGCALEEQLATAPGTRTRIGLVESRLLRRLSDAPSQDPCVGAAIDVILRHRGALPVRDACRAAGVTRQHLARRFAEHVGIRPKLFSRVVRFRHLLSRLLASRRTCWSDIAVALGYYDQSHLIADFHQFAAATPEQFLASRAS